MRILSLRILNPSRINHNHFYRTRVRSFATLVTNSCLVDLIDVTLVREDANSKLFYVVSVADFDYKERDGNDWSRF